MTYYDTLFNLSDKEKIAVIGLGYVGLPLAVEFGKKRQVIGFDINEKRIDELNKSVDITREIAPEVLKRSKYLKFTKETADLRHCNIFIVTVPTPVDSSNRPDLSFLTKACELVGDLLNAGSLIIFESTVYPGCTEEVCVPILSKSSGLTFNEGFFCGYSPERINPGDKVNTLTSIKKITSGSTPEVADFVDELYENIITAGTWKASSIKVAEAAKVIENSQRDLSIAFVNELSLIFDRLGIDTLEVLEAAGSKWNFLPFRPGLVGGHCIGVDPFYLTYKAEAVGYHPQVVLAGRRINDSMASYVATKIVKMMIENEIDVSNAKLGVMGITFKENCPDIRNSKVSDLIYELSTWGMNVVVSDPWADPKQVSNEYNIELEEINRDSKLDAVIVAVGHSEFRNLSIAKVRSYCVNNKPVLGDIKSIYNRQKAVDAGFSVFRL